MAAPPYRHRNVRRRTTEIAVALIILCSLLSFSCTARFSTYHQHHRISKVLRRLNKPALKTFQTAHGDIVDCVHIYDQPAFDHPLLQNYIIQKPTSYPARLSNKTRNRRKNPRNKVRLCPVDYVPIRRTTVDDLLRAKSLEHFGKKNARSFPPHNFFLNSQDNHEHAIGSVSGEYFGVQGILNVWNPYLQRHDELSLSQFWVLGGDFDANLETIELGLQVLPSLYNDYHTRLFLYWTSDGYKTTGCYNLLCSGFIQTSSFITIGAAVSPISLYEQQQYDIEFHIYQDTENKNWYVKVNGHLLGHFPGKLFSSLTKSASIIEFGGEVLNSNINNMHTKTDMGSGYFAEDGYGRACYIRNIKVVNQQHEWVSPLNVKTDAVRPDCYNVTYEYGVTFGAHIYFGGPGGT